LTLKRNASSAGKITTFSEYLQREGGKVFLSFLFSLAKYHKKDGAGCIAIQKSLLTLQTEPLLVGFGQMVATLQPKT
jgi:hypothetical protein